MSIRRSPSARPCAVPALILAAYGAASGALAQQTYTWASATSGNWSDFAAWSPQGVPGQFAFGDSALLTATGSAYTVTLDTFLNQLQTLRLDSSGATLGATGRSLTAQTVELTRGTLRWVGGTFSSLSPASIGSGASVVLGGSASVSGFSSSSGSLRVEGSGAAGSANVGFTGSSPFTNFGTTTLTSVGSSAGATLRILGAFENRGTFESLAGAGGARTLEAGGVSNIGGLMRFDATTSVVLGGSGEFSSSAGGEVRVGPGATLSLVGTGSSTAFSLQNATLNIQSGGAFDATGLRFVHGVGAVVSATGSPTLRNATLELSSSSGSGTFTFGSAATGSNINRVEGDVQTFHSLLVRPQTGDVSLEIPGTMNGGVELSSAGAGANSALRAANIGPFGIVNVFAGSGGSRTLSAPIGQSLTTNRGLINVEADLTVAQLTTLDNRGTLRLGAGRTLLAPGGLALNAGSVVQADAGSALIVGLGPSFSLVRLEHNAGALPLTPTVRSATLAIGGGAPAASYRVEGDSRIEGALSAGGLVTLAPTATLPSPTLLAATPVTNAGSMVVAATPAGVATLAGTMTNAPGGSVLFEAGGSAAVLNGSLDNQGLITLDRSLTIGASGSLRQRGSLLAFPPGQRQITVLGSLRFEPAASQLNTNTTIVNSGLTEFLANDTPATGLVQNTGTLTLNAPGGTLTAPFTRFESSGLLRVLSDVRITNNGRLSVTGGSVTGPASPLPATTVFVDSGQLDLSGPLGVTNVRFDIGAATAIHAATGTTLAPLNFTLRDGATLEFANLGSLRPANLAVNGQASLFSFGTGGGTLTLAAGPGRTARLEQISGQSTTHTGLMVFTGTSDIEEFFAGGFGLFTQPGSTIVAERSNIGTSMRLRTPVDNRGTILVRSTNLAMGRAGVQHFNAGTITIEQADSQLTVVGQSFRNLPGGTISGLGTLNVRQAPFVNAGTISIGRLLTDGAPTSGERGDLIGKFTIDGSVEFEGGSVEFDIAGADSRAYDQLFITSDSSVQNAVFRVAFLGDFQPRWGDRFDLIVPVDGAGLFGSPEVTLLPTLINENLRWWVDADERGLSIGARLIADTNRDNTVNFLDLNNVLAFFGQPGVGAARIGDANEDGEVNFLDLNAVLAFIGQSASSAAIPAPGAAGLACVALAWAGRRRRGAAGAAGPGRTGRAD